MTDPRPFRKVIILCGALAVAAGLSGCDERAMDRTLADIQDIRVDATDGAAEAPHKVALDKKDVDLVVSTARDLTVNKGGLLDKSREARKTDDDGRQMQFAVVDPLDIPRTDNNPPLDERLRGVIFDVGEAARKAAIHDLPDIPVAQVARADSSSARLMSAREPSANIAEATAPAKSADLRIQIGSFGTMDAAKSAWAGLREQYADVTRYNPSYEKVVTSSGKTLVRLKVGPVRDEAQARSLCDKLDIRDRWCAKVG